jgi:hypothetical protein
MESVQRVSINLDLHPEDYRRMVEAARKAQMSEADFCTLAVHRETSVTVGTKGTSWRDDWLRVPELMPADSPC